MGTVVGAWAMRYELLVDIAVKAEILGPFYLPGPVRVGLSECLEELRQNPHVGVLNDPIFGMTKIHEQEYGSILWRVFLFFERDDEAQIVYVKQWRVESGGEPTPPPDEEAE